MSLDIDAGKYIMLPLYIVNDVRLTPTEKLVYGLVYSLSQKKGFCTMSNNKFTELLPANERTIKMAISKLCSYGFIKRELIQAPNNNMIIYRKLYPFPTISCELRGSCGVANLTMVVKDNDSGGEKSCNSVVNRKTFNNNIYNDKRKTSYDINELKKIDTLDFIK